MAMNAPKIRRSAWTYQVEVEILKVDDNTTLGDICAALNQQLKGLFDEAEFTLCIWEDAAAGTWRWSTLREGHRWLAVYVVAGAEGHWIHVDLVGPGPPEVPASRAGVGLFWCKTFQGLAHALEIAALARYCLDDA
jgi:hypothetical protein